MVCLDFSNTILKLADLCKCTLRLHGSIVFEVSARVLITFHDFLVIFNVSFRFILVSIW